MTKPLKQRIKKEQKSGSILSALQLVQEHQGYLTKESVQYVAKVFSVSQSSVYGVATFYHQFTFNPRGKYNIQACMGTACYVTGIASIMTALETELGIKPGEVTTDGLFSIESNTRCLGDCSNAPVILIGEKRIKKANAEMVIAEIKRLQQAEV